jgi:Domain of unknown function (DUF4352)
MNAPTPSQYGGSDPNAPQTPEDAKARAKAEKAYRKAQRPFYKKKRFILPAPFLLLIVVIAATAGGGDKTSSTAGAGAGSAAGGAVSGGTMCAEDYADKQPKDVCAEANGTVTLQGLTVTATPLKSASNAIGGKSLCSEISLKNDSGESQNYNALDFKIQTPSGDVSSTSTMGIGSTLNSGTLVAGGTKTGTICRDDATEKGQYVVIYKPNAFMDDRAVWLFKV